MQLIDSTHPVAIVDLATWEKATAAVKVHEQVELAIKGQQIIINGWEMLQKRQILSHEALMQLNTARAILARLEAILTEALRWSDEETQDVLAVDDV